MALAGVHIVFGSVSFGADRRNANLPSSAKLSQTMAAAGTSTIAAPALAESNNKVLLSISASAPIFYAIGPTPDASGGGSYPRRYYDPAAGREDTFVDTGDKVAWVLA